MHAQGKYWSSNSIRWDNKVGLRLPLLGHCFLLKHRKAEGVYVVGWRLLDDLGAEWGTYFNNASLNYATVNFFNLFNHQLWVWSVKKKNQMAADFGPK